jgi:hypothetical protein
LQERGSLPWSLVLRLAMGKIERKAPADFWNQRFAPIATYDD